ncbi:MULTISPECIES: DUF29 domain-containing protein [Pseudanabaena]|uniref:DUF29 domain-containing protein n=2 Tax=Pseudanabaena TaxID=1152 RepID=L8N4B9_9CYAN|nr:MULTISPECIES: DUF29 domain-containing protein [Pseudanabaena]ELS33949.1 protein of unknown function DUF29 [Pseudanabaena biceps PCC 7429]MDG3493858.1 DUF29 domain-containing protein [Pseudanabaena catenata USMAC16]
MTVINAKPYLKTVYEQDYLLWLETTSEQLRTGQLENLDIENLLEEIESMARKEKVALESNLEVLLMHLLKYQYQVNKRTPSWRYTIDEHRSRILKAIKVSPSLKPHLKQVFDECYQEGRRKAAIETGLNIVTFPTESPFNQEQTLNPDFLPE